MDTPRFLRDIIGLTSSAIGKGLSQSPRLLATTIAVAVVVFAFTLTLTTPSGQKFDTGRGIYATLVMIGCLYLGLVAARAPVLAGALGFRWAPKQGWLFWLWVGGALSVVQLIVDIIQLKYFSGINPGRPAAITTQLFLLHCLMAPTAEEILFRMLICALAIALAGSWGGIMISGALFASAHYLAGVAHMDNLIGGFFLAWLFVKSETILLPIALHSISNLTLVICLALLTPAIPSAPPVPTDKQHAAEVRGIKSTSSDVATTITFINNSQQTIKVYWLDAEGQRKPMETVKPGDSRTIEPTFLMHPWLITDEDDKAWYVYFADAQPRTVEIVAPPK